MSSTNSERKYKGKVMVGKVVSDKMQKTVVVVVETRRRHPLYGKIVTVRRRFKAHNEKPQAKAGDTVKIVESRPLSREKRWRVAEIVRAGEVIEMIRETELESLIEKERVEKEARKEEERKRAAERLAQLGGFESVEEMEGGAAEENEFAEEYEGSDAEEAGDEEDEE
ncbi:MAG: 30S ribosomal protein S17 [Chloroflexota bacterium]|nr:MAG: 30S ribosomal protein S17 [Chloroflexota bacterium]